MKKVIFPVVGFSLLLSGCDMMGESPAYYESGSAYEHQHSKNKNNNNNNNEMVQTDGQRDMQAHASGKPAPQREVTSTSLADPVSTAVPPPKHVVKTTAETGSGPSVPGMAPTVE